MAKVSYVKGYAPWGWVVGSGVYVDAVAKGDLAVRSQQQRFPEPRCLTMLTTSFMLAPAPTSPAASVARQCRGVMQLPGVMEGIAPHAPC